MQTIILMKRTLLILSFVVLHLSFIAAQAGYPIEPVPFTSVKVQPGTFWGHRLDMARRVTVP